MRRRIEPILILLALAICSLIASNKAQLEDDPLSAELPLPLKMKWVCPNSCSGHHSGFFFEAVLRPDGGEYRAWLRSGVPYGGIATLIDPPMVVKPPKGVYVEEGALSREEVCSLRDCISLAIEAEQLEGPGFQEETDYYFIECDGRSHDYPGAWDHEVEIKSMTGVALLGPLKIKQGNRPEIVSALHGSDISAILKRLITRRDSMEPSNDEYLTDYYDNYPWRLEDAVQSPPTNR